MSPCRPAARSDGSASSRSCSWVFWPRSGCAKAADPRPTARADSNAPNRRKDIRGAAQSVPRSPRILVYCLHQFVDRAEELFFANPGDEGDVDGLAIEIAGKVEQEDLEQHDATVEHRPAAKIGDAIVKALADGDPHRIDAVPQPAGRVEAKVSSRKAKLAPALVAMDHLAGDEP